MSGQEGVIVRLDCIYTSGQNHLFAEVNFPETLVLRVIEFAPSNRGTQQQGWNLNGKRMVASQYSTCCADIFTPSF